MRLKKITLLFLVVVFVLSVQGGTAHAGKEWYYCEVEYTGVNGSGIPIVRLAEENGEFSKVFVLPDGCEKESLAVLLTAISVCKMVRVRLDKTDKMSLTAISLYTNKDAP